MAVNIPATLTFPDAEAIVCDYIDSSLEEVTPQIRAYTFLPGITQSDLDDGKTFVLVQRTGGVSDYSGRAPVDDAIISLTVVASTRADSWQIMSYLRTKIYDLASGGQVSGHRIAHVDEIAGPNERMYADPKQRSVQFNFRIGIQRPVR